MFSSEKRCLFDAEALPLLVKPFFKELLMVYEFGFGAHGTSFLLLVVEVVAIWTHGRLVRTQWIEVLYCAEIHWLNFEIFKVLAALLLLWAKVNVYLVFVYVWIVVIVALIRYFSWLYFVKLHTRCFLCYTFLHRSLWKYLSTLCRRSLKIVPPIGINFFWALPERKEGLPLITCLGIFQRLIVLNFSFLLHGHFIMQEIVGYNSLHLIWSSLSQSIFLLWRIFIRCLLAFRLDFRVKHSVLFRCICRSSDDEARWIVHFGV